jgi:hypothetical protein
MKVFYHLMMMILMADECAMVIAKGSRSTRRNLSRCHLGHHKYHVYDPSSYFRCPGFRARPEDRLLVFVFFLSHSRQMPG